MYPIVYLLKGGYSLQSSVVLHHESVARFFVSIPVFGWSPTDGKSGAKKGAGSRSCAIVLAIPCAAVPYTGGILHNPMWPQ